MRIPILIRRKTVVIAMMALALGSYARAQVLDQVPDNALVVLKISNLDKVSRKAAKMAKGLGLDQLAPEFGDPLGAFEEKAHLGKGVDKAGDLAVAYLTPAEGAADSDKSFVALVPISDYAAFLGNFKSVEKDGDVSKATPQEGDAVYVASWGKYAAVSPDKSIVAKKPAQGIKLEAMAAKESASKDVLVYVNMVAVRAKVLPELKKNREQMLGEIEKNFGDTGGDALKQFAPLVRTLVGLYIDAAQEFIQDARAGAFSLNLSDDGITTSAMVDFEPDSFIGKLALQNKNTEAPLTAGLPDRKYFLFGGSVNNPENAGKFMNEMVGPIKAELEKVEAAKKFIPMLEAMQKTASVTTGVALGWVAPTGALGAESIIQQVVVSHGDAKVIHDANTQTFQAMADFFKTLPHGKQGSVSEQLKPNAKTVDGVKLDSFETKMELSDDDPQAAQAKQMMAWIYGPNGQSGLVGEVDAKTFVMIQGGTDQLVEDTIKAAKGNTDVLSNVAGVKAVAAELPKSRTAAIYIDLDTILNTAIRYAKGVGLPVQVKLPQDLPPIGMTSGSEASAFRVDAFVPTTLVQGIVSAGMQMQQQMQKGTGSGL